MNIKGMTVFTLLFGLSCHVTASNDDIVGKWRSIDDKTGFSKAIIEIKQDSNGLYSGTIIDVTPRPDYEPKRYCDKCKGEEKGKPIIGLKILKNLQRDTTKQNEYHNGLILDPLSGNQYKSTLRLNSTGSRLSLRGFVGVEALGRNQTWLRHD